MNASPPENRRYRLALVVLAVVLAFAFHILRNGYVAFRSDHLTQLPLLMLEEDPGLFPRDWFLQNYGHVPVRRNHLALTRTFAELAGGLAPGMFVLFALSSCLTIGAWAAIARRVFGSPWPGLVAVGFAAFYYGWEVGVNHPLEIFLIPRSTAYPAAFWGVWAALSGYPLAAGVLLGASGWLQPAFGPFFAVTLAIWLLARFEKRKALEALVVLASFAAVYLPFALSLRGEFLAEPSVSPAEELHLVAYIRNPHHMLPSSWPERRWLALALLMAPFSLLWWRLRRSRPEAFRFGALAWGILVVLGILTIFIEIVTVPTIVMLQPWRVAVLFYVIVFMVLGDHVVALWRRGTIADAARAMGLIASGAFGVWMVPVLLFETAAMVREWRDRRLPPKVVGAFYFILVAVSAAWDNDFRQQLYLVLFVGFAVGWMSRRLPRHPRQSLAILAAAVLACIAWWSSFFWLPWDRWMDEASRERRKKIADYLLDYQLEPVPIRILEAVGRWARHHTAPDALFIIPPERDSFGFGVWSGRSIVFSAKHFPMNPAGMAEWRRRYLLFSGVLFDGTAADAAHRAEVMDARGTWRLEKDYRRLSAERLVELADEFDADYVVTRDTQDSPRLVKAFETYGRRGSPDDPDDYMYVYEVAPPADDGKTSSPLSSSTER